MVKVSVLYPKQSNTTFDISYYVNSHVKMVQRLLGTRLKGVGVEEGISGIEQGYSPSYAAVGHLLSESVGDFQAALDPSTDDSWGHSKLYKLPTNHPG
jgi:uncharacterized protein (TIGR02118 family)